MRETCFEEFCFSQLSMEAQLKYREPRAGPKDETGLDCAAAGLPINVFSLKQGSLHRDIEMRHTPTETSFHTQLV